MNKEHDWLKRPSLLFLFAILLLGFIVRFYNTPDRFGFDKDPTRDVLITIYGAENLSFPLIGPHSGIGSFTFGPWYYYFLIIFQLLFPFDYAPFYFIPLFSLLFIVIMYFIGLVLCDEKLGVILALIAAISPAQVGPTAGLSNPNLVSVHAALSVLFFLVYRRKKQSLWFSFVWGIILGIGINHHYQMLPLLILPAVAFALNFRKVVKEIAVLFLGLVIAFLPLLIFNFLSQWHTLWGIIDFIRERGGGIYVPNSWKIYLLSFWPTFWSYVLGVPLSIGILYAILVVGAHGYYFLKKKLSTDYLLLIGIFLIFFLALRYYSGAREHYYLFFLHPFLIIFIGSTFWYLFQNKLTRIIAVILIALQVFLIFPEDLQRLDDRSDHLAIRDEAKKLVKKFPSLSYALYNCQDIEINRAQGLAFFLYRQKKLSDNGFKIGLVSPNTSCRLPQNVNKELIPNILDFSQVNLQDLSQNGWHLITPKSIYTTTLEWWKQ
jgi:4-amino-4-deoxy-L-arabinose transferase-like glycosyltransferase